MKEILKKLQDLGFYSYEEPTLVPIIQALQLNNNSLWLTDGRYKKSDALDTTLFSEADVFMDIEIDNTEEFVYLYRSLPPHRCFSFDKEDLCEYPPMIFEDNYLCKSFRRHGVIIENVDEYEDPDENLRLASNAGDFLICPAEFRSSSIHTYLKWQVTTARILSMLNRILSQAGSSEMFYILREEQEGQIDIVLLNLSLFAFLSETKELESQCLPKLIEEYF